jgi:hypothetical protein
MSNQRHMRQELRQGLHQFLMSLYLNYKQSMDADNARDTILSCIEEEYEYFAKKQMNVQDAEKSLDEAIAHIQSLIDKERDQFKAFELHQKMETLIGAQLIMKEMEV